MKLYYVLGSMGSMGSTGTPGIETLDRCSFYSMCSYCLLRINALLAWSLSAIVCRALPQVRHAACVLLLDLTASFRHLVCVVGLECGPDGSTGAPSGVLARPFVAFNMFNMFDYTQRQHDRGSSEVPGLCNASRRSSMTRSVDAV
jgi:hypothetical protein